MRRFTTAATVLALTSSKALAYEMVHFEICVAGCDNLVLDKHVAPSARFEDPSCSRNMPRKTQHR
jgi:hypothetical protein